ncbi:MAG: DNA-3-methyladenine glycosylase [Deltaproteobacteria bacterium]|nr:DNA-3-methyladenine glycosylase [Deltaproteobacteria bacterium]
MKILQRHFYAQNTVGAAKKLLGKFIYHKVNGFELLARIVETEAYTQNDPACHANRGLTPRNKVMFGPGGYAYVYFTYGNHWLLNFVTAKEGKGEAVLIRAVEPVKGIAAMRRNRPAVKKDVDLTNGPGKLTQAMAITKDYYGMDLTGKNFHVLDSGEKPKKIVATTRIGISGGRELPYRFYIKDNPYVSRYCSRS